MFINLVSRSQEDGVVSVPSEGPVSPSVCSVVHMVRTSVRGGSWWFIGRGIAGRSSAVITNISKLLVRGGSRLETVLGTLG